MIKNKRAQEEIVGFSIIIIILAIIILIFFSFSLKKEKVEENYVVDDFIQAMLQYTSNCSLGYSDNYLDVKKLILRCADNENCLNSESCCQVLNETLTGILEQSWKTGENYPYKGYVLNISLSNNEVLFLSKGNITKNYKASSQIFEDSRIFFKVYY